MHRPGLWLPPLLAAAAFSCTPAALLAQSCDSAKQAALILIGSAADARDRDAASVGRCRASLIRSPLSITPVSRTTVRMLRPIPPTVLLQWNSSLPETMNDGALWAGRGLSTMVAGGFRLDRRRFTAIIAPEIVATQNRGFPIIPSTFGNRSEFASPWHDPPQSADLPLRFGTAPLVNFHLGQSTIEVHTSIVGVGFTAENQWWGPARYNAIVMSNNAPGFPNLFLRSHRPIVTPLGDFEARVQLGVLTKSLFFDNSPGSGYRSNSSAVITLRTALDSGLIIGAARSVYAHIDEVGELPAHAADVLWRWNQHRNLLVKPGHASDQIASLFFQWNFPEQGFETYAEWARLVPIRSLRDLIVDPQSGHGYTVGIQWLNQIQSNRALRFQFEATNLTQNPPLPGQRIRTFYTSNISPQGYTHRGQVLGAAIGPGSSSQFLGVDDIRGTTRLGVVVGRIRWEDEAYYQQITGFYSYRHHDISIFAGLRAVRRALESDMSGELLFTRRNNYLFQTSDLFDYSSAFDMPNVTFKLTVSPAR
jgi:hypothetical protein